MTGPVSFITWMAGRLKKYIVTLASTRRDPWDNTTEKLIIILLVLLYLVAYKKVLDIYWW